MNEKTRLQNIFSVLARTYPHAKIALAHQTPWELLVAVILSAQCTDVMVNKITPHLFKKYPTISAFASGSQTELEKEIHSAGFFRNKAKNIIAAAKMIIKQFGENVPKTMDAMLTIPGVARKTANVVLGNAYGVVEGIAVDTHVIRLSQRLRLIPIDKISGKNPIYINNKRIDYFKGASPQKIEGFLMDALPKSQWMAITYQLIDHGRNICKARNPKCSDCPLSSYCPSIH